MQKKREAINIAEEIYIFLKKNRTKEYSINKISTEMKTKYEMTIKCLKFLKNLGLAKEVKGNKKPIPERLFSFNK